MASDESGVRRRQSSTAKGTTILDVAARANVSTATVSRALTAPDMVSAAMRERVLTAVRETGYTPNVAARMLRSARSMMVLAVVPSYVTPFFSELLVCADRALADEGYGLIVGDLIDRKRQVPRLFALAASGQVDGMLILNGEILVDGGRRLDELGVPLVAVSVPVSSNLAIPAILANDRRGGQLVADHLIGLGHKRFAYVSGPAGNHCDTERWAGFRGTLHSAGVADRDIVHIPAYFDAPSGVRAGETFVAMADRPTAVLCASDVAAMGFIHTVQKAGLNVPGDVSVAGYDGIALGQFYSPDLTTVVQPPDLLGRAAAHALVELFRGALNPTCPPAQVVPVSLRTGASTSAPPTD